MRIIGNEKYFVSCGTKLGSDGMLPLGDGVKIIPFTYI